MLCSLSKYFIFVWRKFPPNCTCVWQMSGWRSTHSNYLCKSVSLPSWSNLPLWFWWTQLETVQSRIWHHQSRIWHIFRSCGHPDDLFSWRPNLILRCWYVSILWLKCDGLIMAFLFITELLLICHFLFWIILHDIFSFWHLLL